MNIDRESAREQLRNFNLPPLFNQLGWDRYSQTLPMRAGEVEYVLTGCAEKRGMVVFYYSAPPEDDIPDYTTRSKIEREVTKSVHEHLIIFTNHEKTTQIWQWVKREAGRPAQRRELTFDPTRQEGEALIQRLESITFSLEEEEVITLVDVTSRVRAAFDVERVTKRFYDYFKKEHDAFLQFLDGIPDEGLQRWYVSVILNRLMFIYFIQKKGFLNGDLDYLRTNLSRSRQLGADQYYKEFLCPLFFEGFAKPINERSREMKRLLGNVPYLNGGIFQKHQIEQLDDRQIQIPDAAFERLFTFFERYRWHLDDRPLRNDNEINPDVLGYIFEKYINQKQMGAYYTKEDITEYISKNTIIPFLLDAARKKCEIAFEPPADSNPATVWQLLREQPDRYIYDAVKHGVEHELPPEINAGVKNVSKRTQWNTLALSEYALPTEIWREVVARRQRYKEVHAKLSRGKIHEVNDLITYNLNIRQFAQDIIENCDGPDLLRAFWKAIKAVTILDPTCGSGAFLFAALNILEPLYEACLDRMDGFVNELETAAKTPHPKKYSDFRADLDRIKEHPNLKYFILKSIIIDNLYGVDIMEEAIEICKLRLFLKMVAQVDDVNRIEPLPDIDFNVQAGNTLVGYATYEEAETAITGTFDFDSTMRRIRESAEDVEALFCQFRLQQLKFRGDVTPAAKRELQGKLHELEGELNRYLAGEYQVDSNNEEDYQKWLTSHKPFHWFVEFYGILKKGGFNVIIGNPPYVEYRKIRKDYKILKYDTESCGNLHAFVFERSCRLLRRRGWKSMIVPHSAYCTDRMSSLQNLFHQFRRIGWVHTYGIRPSKLFLGAELSLAIYVMQHGIQTSPTLYASHYHRWHERYRPYLFSTLLHTDVTHISFQNSIPKLHNDIEKGIWKKLNQYSVLGRHLHDRRTSCMIYIHNSGYWIRAMDFAPYFWNERHGETTSPEIKRLYLATELDATTVMSALNSSLFYWWFVVLSTCRTVSLREIRHFRIGLDRVETDLKQRLASVSNVLMTDLRLHAQRRETYYRATGRVVFDEFSPRNSKSIMNDIDRLLAQHYGFTDEELEFIINYDIKYRMGLGSD